MMAALKAGPNRADLNRDAGTGQPPSNQPGGPAFSPERGHPTT